MVNKCTQKALFMQIEEYRANTVGVIAQALKGYVGHTAIISELLQNADDARSSIVSFHLQDAHLEVHNNSDFTEKDWESIREIASGGKHDEEGKIGTFGTGFISIYHITDQPHIFSAGLHKIIQPLKGAIVPEPHPIDTGTVFHFPWRRNDSELSQRIESPIWDDERIREFQREATEFIPEAILFLRNVRQIDIYSEENVVTTVKRTKIDEQITADFRREICQLESNGEIETWLYYHATNERATPGNVKIKDRQLSLALPMGRSVEGKLYNFLPTQIATGLAFHINAAFFPDNNRRGILDDALTNEHRTSWNHDVIETAAELFANAITDIRDQITEQAQSPQDFYHLWPQKKLTDGYNLVSVRERFIERARSAEVIYSSLGYWKRPDHVWIASTPNLSHLTSEHLNIIPDDGKMITVFAREYLGTKVLTLRGMLTQINDHLIVNLPLSQAHPIINTRQCLELLYEELPKHGESDFDWICKQPIFLSETEILVTPAQLWRADAKVLSLFKPDDRPFFADTEFEKQWPEGYVASFKGAELVDWLWQWEQSHPEDVFFDSADHLKRVLEFIASDIERVHPEKLKQLYIVLAEGRDGWYSSEGNIFFAKAPSDYELGLPNLLLIRRTLAENTKTKAVYQATGIQTLQSPDIVDLVEAVITQGFEFDLRLTQKMYRYFGKEQLSSNVVERLKDLPIYLTAGGRWTSLTQQPDLSLKPRVQIRGWDEVSDVLNKLQLDNLIHRELEGEARFLSKVGIRPLDEPTFNHRLIETYYASSQLLDEDRLTLFEYLRDSVFEHDADLTHVMQKAHLILCDDGEYRSASEVYFASPLLDNVFDREYPRPHSLYSLEIADKHGEGQTPYHQNRWYRFFSQLGMLEAPSPQDVIARIQQHTTFQPNSSSIEAIGRIFEYLDELPKDKLTSYHELSSLAWLPAQRDNKTWHLSSEIYEKRHEKLIGNEAPILRFTINSSLRQILGIPERPNGDLVAHHLIACIQLGNLADDGSVYRHLGKFWHEIEPENQHYIRNNASIWDSGAKRFWKPDQCFIGKQEQPYFGVFRHYRETDDGDVGLFYRNVGIREKASNEQRLAFLREITTASTLTEDRRILLLENLRLIGAEIDHYRDIVSGCRQIRIVPDEDFKLHRANTVVLDDQPGLRDKFSRVDLLFVHKDFDEETVVAFWNAIGVTRLSTAKPKIIEIQDKRPDNTLKQRLIDRIPHLRRIIYHEKGHSELAYNLNSINVFMCNQLLTSYQILEQESSPEQEDTAFDAETKSLYCVQGAKNIRLARKLLEIMRLHGVIDPATIEAVLDRELAEIGVWLDDAGYKSPPREHTGSITNPEIPLAKPSESEPVESPETGDPTSQDILQEFVDEIVTGDDVEEEWHEGQQRQYTGYGTGWGSSSHAPHYPNNPSELIDRFGVEQEFPERPSFEFPDDFDEDNFDFDEDIQIAENDFPETWEEAFPNASQDTWSGLSSWFSQSRPNEFFRDARHLQRDLPKPEDRKGVFQIICETFPQDGAVMHIDAIRSAVWERRQDIAEGTISSILSRARPCFESLGNGYWSFNAKFIRAGYANLNDTISLYGRWVYGQTKSQSTSGAGVVKPAQGRSGANSGTTSSRADNNIIDQTDIGLSDGILINLETFLHHIPADTQEHQHDIIRRTAQHTEQEQHYDLSLVLYELLHKRGVKGFEKKIIELQRRIPLTEISQRIASIPLNDPKRWNTWLEAWQKHPDLAALRDMIRNDVKRTSSSMQQMASEFIRDATEEVAQEYIGWMKQICPLWSAWHQDEMTVLGESLPLVFDWLMQKDYVDLAVAVIAQCPPHSRLLRDARFIDMNRYLYAVDAIADWLLQHKRPKSASVLQVYALFVAKNSGQKLIDIKEYERKVASNPISKDDLVNASQDGYLHKWVNHETLERIIKQYS